VGSFQVSTDDLAALTGRLSSLAGELGQAGHIQVDPGAAGHPAVESSLQSFFSDWSDGLQQVQNNLSQLSRRLGVAVENYDSVEGSATAAFSGR